MPKPLDACEFKAHRTNTGHYTGRCAEWPDLHTRPHTKALDAIDDIISQVRDKLAHIHATAPIPKREANSGG